MDWNARLKSYRQTGFPICMAVGEDGRLFGIWNMGNDYRVSSGLYGGYPATYLRRVKALFPEKRNVLHVFSGRVDLEALPGDTVDINEDFVPDFVDDAQRLENVPLHRYDLVLCDPPYSVEDAEHYQTTMVKRHLVMRALRRTLPGTHVVWLDQVHPMYRKLEWDLVGQIGMVKSINHRYRVVTIFERKFTPGALRFNP